MALVLQLFANGADTVPVAAWLAPVFMLRFVRRRRARTGLSLAYVALVAALAFQFRGMVPIPGIGYAVFLVMFGIVLVLPYVADRLLATRLRGFAASLVFPAAWVVVEYLVSFAPYGTWGSAAYSQYGELPLLQLLSVTGLWGITFLIGWFAATCNGLWQAGVGSAAARSDFGLCAGVIATVLLLGGVRMAVFPPSAKTVRIASLSRSNTVPPLGDAVRYRMITNQATPDDVVAIGQWMNATDEDLLRRAERELQAGAKIVFWAEINAQVLDRDEAGLLARGARLAERHRAYIGMALAVWHPGAARPNENKLVLVGPDGRVQWVYTKARPVPGGEAAMQVAGDGRLRHSDTPFGRLSGVICFDADFPQLLAQAGAMGADIMLDPSSDWPAIDPWHTRMASFRALEQGFNLVRQTSDGLSAAYDYQGRPLASVDDLHSADHAMVSYLPVRGTSTLYARLGDWFAWLCGGTLLLLIARAAGWQPGSRRVGARRAT